jgi:hypothetical protein
MEIKIQLDSQHTKQLAYIQQHTHLDPVTVLNQRIEQEYTKLQTSRPNPLQLFEQAGLVGCFEGDSDLSTNYKSLIADCIAVDHQQQSQD